MADDLKGSELGDWILFGYLFWGALLALAVDWHQMKQDVPHGEIPAIMSLLVSTVLVLFGVPMTLCALYQMFFEKDEAEERR